MSNLRLQAYARALVAEMDLMPKCSVPLEAAGMRMYELACAMPGFMSYKDFTAEDGESVSIVEFGDAASLQAWRNHPEHLRIQQRGREEFRSEYHIQVCRPEREYSFKESD